MSKGYVDPILDGGESLRLYIEQLQREVCYGEDDVQEIDETINDLISERDRIKSYINACHRRLAELQDELDNCHDCIESSSQH